MISEDLDTNNASAKSSALTLTNETLITLYVFDKTGSHANHRVGLEVSPDGTNWHLFPGTVKAGGVISHQIVAQQVRACVSEAEGSESLSTIHLMAR